MQHYRLDRITSARLEADSFARDPGFDLTTHAARAFGDGARHFEDQAALIAALREALAAAAPGTRCLVKGSRSSAMDKVVAALLAADREGDAPHVA